MEGGEVTDGSWTHIQIGIAVGLAIGAQVALMFGQLGALVLLGLLVVNLVVALAAMGWRG